MTQMNFEANNMKPHHGTEKSCVSFVAVKTRRLSFFWIIWTCQAFLLPRPVIVTKLVALYFKFSTLCDALRVCRKHYEYRLIVFERTNHANLTDIRLHIILIYYICICCEMSRFIFYLSIWYTKWKRM